MDKNCFGTVLLEHLPTGIGVFDVTGTTIDMQYLNEGYYQMIGTKRCERTRFFGKKTTDAIHPDDRKPLIEEVMASIREKRLFHFRFRVFTGNGTYLWIGINANHEPLTENTERFYASYYDIDTLLSTQKQLESDKKVMEAMLGNIPGGVAVFSEKNGKIHMVYTNDGFYSLHHGSRAFWAARGDDPVDWLEANDRHVFLDEFQKVKNGEKEQGRATYRVDGEDGSSHWVDNQFRKAYEESGVQYYYASFVGLDGLKRAEETRDEARRMYESAVEDSKLVVWEYDIPAHRIIMAENEFTKYDYRKFGLPKIIENAPQALLPFIDDAYHEPFLEMYRKVERGEPTASCEVWYKLKPGVEPRCEHISYTTVFDAQGKTIKAYGIGRNITNQKQQEEDYHRLRNQLTGNLLDVVGSFQLNLSKNTYISGYSPYTSVVKGLEKATADEHFAATAQTAANETIKAGILKDYTCQHLLQMYRDGQKQIQREYPVHTSSGGIMWIHSTLYMMQNPDTGDVEGITYSKDVTRQKKNEKILQRLYSKDCDYVGLAEMTTKTFEAYNGSWESRDIPKGKQVSYPIVRDLLAEEYVSSEERQAFLEATDLPKLAEILKKQTDYTFTYTFIQGETTRRKQIRFGWLDEEEREILIIQTDVTEAYQKEQEQIARLNAALEEAEKANKAKSEFLSRMSHDIRTPLNGIIGMTYLMENMDLPKEAMEDLHNISTSSKFLLSLINDILDMSKAESGKIELHPEPYRPKDFLNYIDAVIGPLCREKNLKLVIGNDQIPGIVPLMDELRTNQILFNLFSNAVKYTPEGGTVTFTLKENLTNDNKLAMEISISDTGIGMSPEFQKVLFQPFTQERLSNQPETQGTGLGLSIVKRLVDVMGGTIRVKSVLGKGSTFILNVAVAYAAEAETSSQSPIPASAKADISCLSGKHILLFEDHPLNQIIAVSLLQRKGMIVETADNGETGTELFKRSAPHFYDAILMDIRMPIMDGYAATQEIRSLAREDAKTIPIIAMTADAFSDDVKKAQEAGMNGHIAKPIEPDVLYKTLAKHLQG